MPADVLCGSVVANVSRAIPALHPFIAIGGMAAAHTPGFAAQSDTEEAYTAMPDGGVAMAWTAVDAASDPAIRRHLCR
jgi:hypothetical protein